MMKSSSGGARDAAVAVVALATIGAGTVQAQFAEGRRDPFTCGTARTRAIGSAS